MRNNHSGTCVFRASEENGSVGHGRARKLLVQHLINRFDGLAKAQWLISVKL